MERRTCQYCKKTIPKRGDKRKNGKQGFIDWSTRKYCGKCWEIVNSIKIYERERELEKELQDLYNQ